MDLINASLKTFRTRENLIGELGFNGEDEFHLVLSIRFHYKLILSQPIFHYIYIMFALILILLIFVAFVTFALGGVSFLYENRKYLFKMPIKTIVLTTLITAILILPIDATPKIALTLMCFSTLMYFLTSLIKKGES